MSDNVVIYHHPCDDGFGAALAAWLALGGNALFLPWNYGKDALFAEEHLPHMKDKNVYLLDFSFPAPIMDRIVDDAARFVWLDHHKTAFEMWLGDMPQDGLFQHDRNGVKIELNNSRSGAYLAWKHFHPDTEVPRLYEHIDDRDRWQFKLVGTNAVTFYLRSQSMDFPTWRRIMDTMQTDEGWRDVIRQGAAIEQYFSAQKHMIDSECAMPVKIMKPNGDVVQGWGANTTKMFSSDLGHILCKRNNTFGLTWYQAEDGMLRFSLRSEGAFDVSEIAKIFGGGGHRNAAGFELSPHTVTASRFLAHRVIHI